MSSSSDRRNRTAGWRYVVINPLPATLLNILMLVAIGGLGALMIWPNYSAALKAGEARAK